MIEVIYKEEKQEAKGNEALFSVPRNVRQIGLTCENYRIYMEDYVYTFLGRLSQNELEKENTGACLAVLTGETKWAEGITYLFIRGALKVEEMEAAADHIDFTEEIWKQIGEEKEKYFPQQEIVGWFFARPQLLVEMTETFMRAHLKHFGGEKVLMLMEPVEREDAFFRYENGFMARQRGYYIFYEKNPLMQTYMIEKQQENRPEAEEEIPDDAVKTFRKIIQTRKKEEPKQEEERPSVFSYAATACLALAVLTVGVNFYRNYQNMQALDREVEEASAVIREENGQSFSPRDTKVKPEITLTPTPSVIPSAVPDEPEGNPGETRGTAAEGTSAEETAAGAESIFYREESDVRKAKRRETLASREKEKQEKAAVDASVTKTVSPEKVEKENAVEDKTAAVNQVHDTYVIRPGDTLYQISIAKYGDMEAISEICRLNNLTPEEIIYPGQIIVLP